MARNARFARNRPVRKVAPKRQIVWKDPLLGAASVARVAPAGYVATPNEGIWANTKLTLGMPVIAMIDLQVSQERGTYKFAPIERFWGEPGMAPVPKGSLLMYAGTIRATERGRINGKTCDVQVIKHTFVTPVGRCIVHDLALVGPVT